MGISTDPLIERHLECAEATIVPEVTNSSVVEVFLQQYKQYDIYHILLVDVLAMATSENGPLSVCVVAMTLK